MAVAGFGGVQLHWHMGAAAAPLLRAQLVPFIGQKPAHRRKQESSETAPLTVRVAHPIALKQSGEEGLCQILRVLRRMSAAADIGVKGIPISLA